ncbi:C40 family peptidase [Amedibacterium intestinale]|uniref:C40 family peptidase n=1 Tax=Amedibacterium intestinale TaxID=2583452 RepID=UPI00296EA925
MRKILFIGTGFLIFLFLMMVSAGGMNEQKKSILAIGNSDSSGASCNFDDDMQFIDPELENLREEAKRKLIDETYANVLLSVYGLEKETKTLDDIVGVINSEIEYTIKNKMEFESTAYIQAYKFGLQYFDFLKKNNQTESSPYYAKKYIEENSEMNYTEEDSTYSIRATQLLSNGCNFDSGNLGEDEILDFEEVAKKSAMGEQNFIKLMAEATKYIGMPYVYGGSSPETSFDCSGFVIWVYKQTGLYPMDRITAQGIYNKTLKINSDEATAGDLVFFTKTYDFYEPVTHIGIYVGNNKMLHCGNPIGYADLTDEYWKSHFYGFGRLPIEKLEKE